MAEMNISDKKIKDFKPGDVITGFFYVRVSELKQTTSNNKYMNFIFSDKTGDVNAKLWDWDEDNVKRFAAGIVVKAKGQVIDWQGQLQFKIERIRRTIDTDNISISDFVPSAPESASDMLNYIESVAASFTDFELKALISELLNTYKERLLIYPAAKKNHHAVRSGLLFHISTMLKGAEALVRVYPFLNKDLLFFGVIVHDIGKIEEMNITDSGLVDEYSNSGMLLGHITQGIIILDNAAVKLGISAEKKMLLEHMILSHHYEPEYGSPKMPMFPEAEMLHYLDVMDARMYDMHKALEAARGGSFSEKIWSLENRVLYKADGV